VVPGRTWVRACHLHSRHLRRQSSPTEGRRWAYGASRRGIWRPDRIICRAHCAAPYVTMSWSRHATYALRVGAEAVVVARFPPPGMRDGSGDVRYRSRRWLLMWLLDPAEAVLVTGSGSMTGSAGLLRTLAARLRAVGCFTRRLYSKSVVRVCVRVKAGAPGYVRPRSAGRGHPVVGDRVVCSLWGRLPRRSACRNRSDTAD
jgi:hypothetical protein